MSEWHSDSEHVVIMGATRSGKSVLSNQLHHATDRVALYWYLDAEDDDMIRGRSVRTHSGLIQSLRSGARCIAYRPTSDDWAARDEFREFVDLVFTLAEQAPNTEFQIVVDEAHEQVTSVSQPAGDDPVMRLVKRGAGKGVKVVLTTQNPSSVPNACLSNSYYHVWVGQPSNQDIQYLDRYGYEASYWDNFGEHEAALMSNNGEELARFRADSEYA